MTAGRHRLPRRAHRRRRPRASPAVQFDCVGVFAPFTLEALEAAGLARGVQLGGLPRHHPRPHRGVAGAWWRSSPKVAQKIVERLVRHARLHRGEPRRGVEDHGRRGRGLHRRVRGLRQRHEALHRRRGARGVPARRHDVTSLEYTAKLINPFLVESGLTEKKASLKGLFAPQFTQAYADRAGTVVVTSRRDGDAAPTTGIDARAPAARRRRAGRGRRQHALFRLRGEIPLGVRVGLAVSASSSLVGLWWLAADVLASDTFLSRARPTPSAGSQTYWNSGDLGTDLKASGAAHPQGLLDQPRRRRRARRARSAASGRWRRSGSRRSGSCATSRPPRSRRCSSSGSASTRRPKVALIIAGTVFFNIVMIADVARAGAARDDPHRVHARRRRLRVLAQGGAAALACRASSTSPGSTSRPRGRCSWSPSCSPRTDGLGYRLDRAAPRQRQVDQIFAILLVFAVIGIASDLVLRWLRNRVSPWARP